MKRTPILLIIFLIFSFVSRLSAESYNLAAESLFTRGKAYFRVNRYKEAEIEFKKCLMLAPNHKEAKELLERCQKKTSEFTSSGITKQETTKSKPLLREISPSELHSGVLTQERLKEKAMQLAMEEVEKETQRQKSPWILMPTLEIADWALKQGTWHLKQGDFYGEIYAKYYWHNQRFDHEGHKKRWDYGGEYYELATEYKMEYGFTDRYTLVFNLSFKEAQWKDNFKKYSNNGFVYLWSGVKYLLFEKPFFCSWQGKIKFPLHLNESAVPALGRNQNDAEIKLLTAQPWPKLPGYTKLELGFRARNEEPTNEIIYFSQLAYNATKNLLLELSLDGQEGLTQSGGIDEDWTKFSFGPVFKFGGLNIKLGYGNTWLGKNTSAAEEVYLSVYAWW